MTKKAFFGLLGWLLVTFLAAAVGALASISAPEFYAQLSQPDWAPPSRVFGPVWNLLYLLMAIAAWLVWKQEGFERAGMALSVYLVQLFFNALWSWLFFAWHLGAFAFADILVLWCLIAATLVLFWRVRPLAGVLIVPYLAWVTFALALSYNVWQQNPSLL